MAQRRHKIKPYSMIKRRAREYQSLQRFLYVIQDSVKLRIRSGTARSCHQVPVKVAFFRAIDMPESPVFSRDIHVCHARDSGFFPDFPAW